jgi:hypothetical protein
VDIPSLIKTINHSSFSGGSLLFPKTDILFQINIFRSDLILHVPHLASPSEKVPQVDLLNGVIYEFKKRFAVIAI